MDLHPVQDNYRECHLIAFIKVDVLLTQFTQHNI